jgi:hypothetical protein
MNGSDFSMIDLFSQQAFIGRYIFEVHFCYGLSSFLLLLFCNFDVTIFKLPPPSSCGSIFLQKLLRASALIHDTQQVLSTQRHSAHAKQTSSAVFHLQPVVPVPPLA